MSDVKNTNSQYHKYKEQVRTLSQDKTDLENNINELTGFIESIKKPSFVDRLFGRKPMVPLEQYEQLFIEAKTLRNENGALKVVAQDALMKEEKYKFQEENMSKAINFFNDRFKMIERDWLRQKETLRIINQVLSKKSYALKQLHRLAEEYGVFNEERAKKKDAWFAKQKVPNAETVAAMKEADDMVSARQATN